MDMNQFWATFWSIVGPLIIALLTWIAKGITSWLASKTSSEKGNKFVNDISDIIFNAVICITQSFVDDLKKADKFGPKEQEEAKEKAYNIVVSQLTPKLKKYIEDNFGDVREYVLTKIEAVLWQTKK